MYKQAEVFYTIADLCINKIFFVHYTIASAATTIAIMPTT